MLSLEDLARDYNLSKDKSKPPIFTYMSIPFYLRWAVFGDKEAKEVGLKSLNNRLNEEVISCYKADKYLYIETKRNNQLRIYRICNINEL